MIPSPEEHFSVGTGDVQESLGRTVDALFEYVALLSVDGTVTYLNKAAHELTLAGKPLPPTFTLALFQPEWVVELLREEAFPIALRDGLWRGETAVLRADGTELPVHQTLLSVGTAAQPRLASVMRDMSQEKREELERIEQTNAYESAIRASGHLLFRWDPATGEIVYHGNAEQLTGYTPAELTGGLKQLRSLIHPDDLSHFDREIQRVSTSRSGLALEFRIQRPEGQYVIIQMRGAFFLDRTGNFSQLAGFFTDVTALWETQEQLALAREKLESRLQTRLQEARDEADQARRSKGELLSRMSHELRTPLNAILGFTQLLELEQPTPRQTESIEHIARAGQNLLALINEVLDLARLESGRLPMQCEPVEVSVVLRLGADLVYPLAERSRIAVKIVDAPPGLPTHVLVDPQRLKQVLLSLLTNAVKHNTPQGTVTLAATQGTQGRIRFTVTDTGAGFSPPVLQSMLAPFEWQEAGKTGPGGAGFALSRAIAHALKGDLGGESELGKGSKFWIEIPACSSDPTPALAAQAPAKRKVAPGVEVRSKILYVEDEELNLQLVERVLASHPEYELVSTMQGQHAVELAREHQPDLILLDLNLPDLSGEIVLAHLKDDPALRDIPVIMVTADVMGDRVERLLAGGALTYLTKPFRISEFLTVIRETLERRVAVQI